MKPDASFTTPTLARHVSSLARGNPPQNACQIKKQANEGTMLTTTGYVYRGSLRAGHPSRRRSWSQSWCTAGCEARQVPRHQGKADGNAASPLPRPEGAGSRGGAPPGAARSWAQPARRAPGLEPQAHQGASSSPQPEKRLPETNPGWSYQVERGPWTPGASQGRLQLSQDVAADIGETWPTCCPSQSSQTDPHGTDEQHARPLLKLHLQEAAQVSGQNPRGPQRGLPAPGRRGWV